VPLRGSHPHKVRARQGPATMKTAVHHQALLIHSYERWVERLIYRQFEWAAGYTYDISQRWLNDRTESSNIIMREDYTHTKSSIIIKSAGL
jgi:hypothetical protein